MFSHRTRHGIAVAILIALLLPLPAAAAPVPRDRDTTITSWVPRFLTRLTTVISRLRPSDDLNVPPGKPRP